MLSRIAFIAALIAPSVGAQPAPSVAGRLPAAEQAALDRIRHDVWANWFRGDTAALHRVLPPELVAITNGSPHWRSLEQTLAESAEFARKGGKFVSVAFDSALTQRFGDVAVLFSHYRVTTESDGKRSTSRGRATEVFVKSSGRWVHTSWHLDRIE